MNTIEAIHGRRSIRVFRPDPVPRPLIEDLLWDAAQAPTPPISGNTPWAFCVIEGVQRLARYGERARQYASEHQPPDSPWDWVQRSGFKVFWGAPAAVLICGQRGNPEAAMDFCRAGQALMLAAYARGLGSCWVGAPLPWLRSPGIAQELGLPQGFDVTVVMILGQADETPVGNPRPRPPVHWCQADPAGCCHHRVSHHAPEKQVEHRKQTHRPDRHLAQTHGAARCRRARRAARR